MFRIIWRDDSTTPGWHDLVQDYVLDPTWRGGFIQHIVAKKHAGRLHADCNVVKEGNFILLEYSKEQEMRNGVVAGTTRLTLSDGELEQSVEWRWPGGDFEKADAEIEEIPELGMEEKFGSTTVKFRRFQNAFRNDLMERWDRKCALTGIAWESLLRASHIVPVREETGESDSDNGLLLAAHIDVLFDARHITFDDDGNLLWAGMVPKSVRDKLNLPKRLLKVLNPSQRKYMAIHRGLTKI